MVGVLVRELSLCLHVSIHFQTETFPYMCPTEMTEEPTTSTRNVRTNGM